MNASDPQRLRDLDEHRPVFDVDNLPGRDLSDVQRHPINILIGLAKVDEAGGDEEVHKAVQLELPRLVGVEGEVMAIFHLIQIQIERPGG